MPPHPPAGRELFADQRLADQQMMQLSGHRGGEVAHHALFNLHPFTVRYRHHVARRRRYLLIAPSSCVSPAHHVVIPALFYLKAGNNPHAVSNGKQLTPGSSIAAGQCRVGHRLPARIACRSFRP